jgi:glycosyltransferase involved in cell wall biosynthesis
VTNDGRPLRVMMLGLRGFPDVQGGIERHAEHLCPLLVKNGCDVDVLVRSRYVPLERGARWRGVRYLRIWSPKSAALETIVHSFLGVLVAGWRRPDIVHIHAIGPALMVPLARLLGLRVVVTHHGPDYQREKWGKASKWALRLGEMLGMRFAHRRIVVSRTIAKLIRRKYHLVCQVIPNGVTLPVLPTTTSALKRFNLTPGKYLLTVSRLVPEKRHTDLIAAFRAADLPEWKLVLVGGAGSGDPYADRLDCLARSTPGAVMTGVQIGDALQELYAHAGAFVLPSSHEGLPIALIEALGFGLPVIASDIPPHLELGLADAHYFPLGDVLALTERMKHFVATPWPMETRRATREWLAKRDDWRIVAEQTLSSYWRAVDPRRDLFKWRPAARRPRHVVSASR